MWFVFDIEELNSQQLQEFLLLLLHIVSRLRFKCPLFSVFVLECLLNNKVEIFVIYPRVRGGRVQCPSGRVKNIPPSPVLNFNLDYVRAPPAIFCIPLWTKITFSKEWAANTIWIKLYTQTINKTQQSGVTTTNYKTSSWSGETRNKNENEKQTGGFIFWDHHHQEHNRNSIITEELSYYVFHRSFHR